MANSSDNVSVGEVESGTPLLSVVIISLNEAHNIRRCLESVSFADEIVLLDSGSTDETVAIARELGAHVQVNPDWAGFGIQKNRALALARGQWILSLDCDEWVDQDLRGEILKVLAACTQAGQPDVWRMPRRSRFCGRVIRHSGWSPDYVVRLWKSGSARFSDHRVHEHIVTAEGSRISRAGVGTLRHPLDHDTVVTFEQVIEKMNRYSSDSARMMVECGRQGSLSAAILHGLWAFFRTYVLRLGFLDGSHGFMLAVSNAEGSYYRYIKSMRRG